jgi:hypothetical protein
MIKNGYEKVKLVYSFPQHFVFDRDVNVKWKTIDFSFHTKNIWKWDKYAVDKILKAAFIFFWFVCFNINIFVYMKNDIAWQFLKILILVQSTKMRW